MLNQDLLKALMAQNPDYNVSLEAAHKFSSKLAKLGIIVTGFYGTVLMPVPGFSSQFPAEAEMIAAGVPVGVPIDLQMAVEGCSDMFQVGLTIQAFGDGDELGVMRVFACIYGPSGQARASSAMLGLPGVREAIKAAWN